MVLPSFWGNACATMSSRRQYGTHLFQIGLCSDRKACIVQSDNIVDREARRVAPGDWCCRREFPHQRRQLFPACAILSTPPIDLVLPVGPYRSPFWIRNNRHLAYHDTSATGVNTGVCTGSISKDCDHGKTYLAAGLHLNERGAKIVISQHPRHDKLVRSMAGFANGTSC
ncbi:hypothetical protein ACM61V_15960 [Sphingomonas sp. TX0543]|uniref:hypothetical protein n=2 Tax=unclassified Sphingomonas TaxID=196159 RepID=UPI003AFA4CAC